MLRIAIDTNRYVDFAKGDPVAVEMFRRADPIAVPIIVLAELRAGFLCGSRSAENEKALSRFLSSRRVLVLAPNEETTLHYARLFVQLRHQGTPVPTNDLWIAALAIQHHLTLFARDAHFDHLPQIPRL